MSSLVSRLPWRLARLDPRLSVVAVTSAICVLRLYTCSTTAQATPGFLCRFLERIKLKLGFLLLVLHRFK